MYTVILGMNFVSEKSAQKEGNSEEPEEPVDRRPLYHRLKEVKDKKQLEYDEEHMLKNQFRGIDDGEADFLAMVDKSKEDAAMKRRQEEEDLVKAAMKYNARPANSNKPANKQASIIASGIRKRTRISDENCVASPLSETAAKRSSLCKVAGILPGLVDYVNSSDSNSSSESDDEILPSLVRRTPNPKEGEDSHSH
uniref:FAM192A/Fyv6 N-terminal domain-containing protein n=1 Tax=Ditylenchus dipsaci TaxID=166011 RepID=A0A915EN36_9BILA